MSQFEDAKHYLPHEQPMVLVETVHDVGPEHAICGVTVSENGILAPFINEQGELPAWFAIEMMAQTIGVWSGWHGIQQNKTPRLGLLLGTRAFKSELSAFPADSQLTIHVQLLLRDDKLGNFDCRIEWNDQIVTQAKLNVYEPDDQEIEHLINQGKGNSNS